MDRHDGRLLLLYFWGIWPSFLDGLASYSIPEGGTIAAPGFPIVYLNDSTYDGYQERRWEKSSCSLSVTVQVISSFLLALSLVSFIPNISLRPPELQANLLVLQSIVSLLFQALWHIVSCCFLKEGMGSGCIRLISPSSQRLAGDK